MSNNSVVLVVVKNWHYLMFLFQSYYQILPNSRCVEPCHLGHSRTVKEGKPVCCYDCSWCPEDMISDHMGKDNLKI